MNKIQLRKEYFQQYFNKQHDVIATFIPLTNIKLNPKEKVQLCVIRSLKNKLEAKALMKYEVNGIRRKRD